MNLTYEEKDKYIYIKANQRKNYSLRKSKYFKTYTEKEKTILDVYPIKPYQNIISNDINFLKIFLFEKTSTQNINKIFNIKYDNIHDLNLNRRKILYKIKEFLYRYNIDYKIYYKIIMLYDLILIENENKKLLSNDEIALGALVLSVKFNYIENKMFSIKKFLNLYDNKIYTLEHLIKIERICLYLAKYCLTYKSPMCFLEFFFINGIIFSTDFIKKDSANKIYDKVEQILEKIMEESNNYLKYNFFYLACSIVAYVRENFELEKWPTYLQNTFGIDFINFKKEYDSLFLKDNKDNIYLYNNKEIIIKGNNNTILLNFQNKNNNNNILSKSTSNFNLYQNISHNLNNKYCNNIINININNFSLDNNNINSYLFKKSHKQEKSFDKFSLKKNDYHLKLIHKFNSKKISDSNINIKDENPGLKLIQNHIFKNSRNYINNQDKSITYFSPEKNIKIKKYLKNKNIYDEMEEENSKNSSNELNNESNKIILDKRKNYNFSSRFKLNKFSSKNNISTILNSNNSIKNLNNSNSKLPFTSQKTVNEYNADKLNIKKNNETPKKTSIFSMNKTNKKIMLKNYTEKKMFQTKTNFNNFNISMFEIKNKSKNIDKNNNNNSNEKKKKENKIKNKIRYNNLIKYKLSMSSATYKTKYY